MHTQAMSHVRNTIELLSKILKENGTSKVQAEIFRQAKFDSENAVAPMWKLLFELLYYCDHGKIDDVSLKACKELSEEELVVYVKWQLQKLGFFSKEFANLPTDMSTGSREIMLAFGWLLCKENIIRRFMQACSSPLDDDTASLHEVMEVKPVNSLPNKKQDAYSKLQQLLWMNNKLRLNLRSLHATQREKNILKHKIHEATLGVRGSPDRNHLSQLEVYMLRHPELLKNNLCLLEKDSERLQNLLLWRDHEDSFWKWMGSVLDAKIKDKSVANPAAGDSAYSQTADVDTEALERMAQSHLTLQEVIIKYESIVEHLDRMWEDKNSEVTEDVLDKVLQSLERELSVQKANVASSNCQRYLNGSTSSISRSTSSIPSQPPPRKEPELILHKPVQNRPLNPRLDHIPSVEALDHLDGIRDIEAEINCLYELVDGMQQEVEDKQNNFKQELQLLSSKFKDAICIPPMSIKC